jgi:hypothetical protein
MKNLTSKIQNPKWYHDNPLRRNWASSDGNKKRQGEKLKIHWGLAIYQSPIFPF